MDLAKLEMNDTFNVEIVLPDGSPTDLVIEVCGIDSPLFKKCSLQRQNKSLQGMKRGKQKVMSAEELEQRDYDTIVSCTVGWSGFERGDKAIEFNTENVEAIYREHGFIKDQVNEAIADRVNFMKR
jgi:hypothetical protein